MQCKYGNLLLIFCLCLLSSSLLAQSKQELKEEAKAYLAVERYEDAIRTLQRSRQLVRSDEESRFLLAVCHYQINQLEQSQELLNALTAEDKSPYPECWWYLARILHAQQQFGEAAAQYKMYLRTLRGDHPNRPMTIEAIRRCDNGLRLLYRDPQAIVENMGQQVNTAADEFGPVPSPNRSTRLYFSSIRPGNSGGPRNKYTQTDEQYGSYLSDMYSTDLTGGQWQRAQAMHSLLNSPQHEYLIGFSGGGQVLLYFQGWNWDRGEIFADTFRQERSLTTTPFLAPASGQGGDQALHVYYDTLLIFASRRPGGYGGLDLYRSSLRDGRWTAAENMGPEINTPFDETTPFLARDGVTLYFSTNSSRKSIGGLDIVRSVYLPEAKRWSEPENLGVPINSAADDSHFQLARDGFTGFFASARKDGFGQRDLYLAYFTKYRKEMEPPVLAYQPPSPPTSPNVSEPTPPTQVNPPPSNTISPPEPVAASGWSSELPTTDNLASPAWYDQLQQAYQQYPGDRLIISCYVPTQGGSLLTTRLYNAIQKLEALANRLENSGVPRDKIFMRTLKHSSSNYRLAAHLAPQQSPVQSRQAPVIGVSTPKGPSAMATDQALCYKVQVAAVQRTYANEKLSAQADIMLEKAGDSPYYRYTAGAFSSFRAASDFRRTILAQGFRGAYIVPYLYGARLDKSEVSRYVSEYPDLRAFLGR
ncbi:MAG: tetratricopeptide repeat protein [Bacteroidota bacterium]